MIKILIIEDDEQLSENVSAILQELGHITQAFDGDDGLFEAESKIYDLIVLDVMLPGMDGYDVLAKLRQQAIQIPVLMLTAKDGLEDKITGFQKGADDYLTKPFHREELLMRVKAILKRSLGLFNEQIIEYGSVQCDLSQHQVLFNKSVLPIQGKEFELFTYFLQNRGIILTKEQIFDRIWGFDSETNITVVEVYVSHLRKHLRATGVDKQIRTIRSVGYLMNEQVEGDE